MASPASFFTLKNKELPSLADLMIEAEGKSCHEVLTAGDTFQKVMINGKSKSYFVRLDPSCHFILMGTSKKIPLSKVEEVRVGHLTETFLRYGDKFPEDHCFSVVYTNADGRPHAISLVAKNSLLRSWWETALLFLLARLSEMRGESYSMEVPWLEVSAGKDTLSSRTVLQVLRSMNLKVSSSDVKRIIRQVDTGEKDGRLSFPEFVTLLRMLRSRDIICEIFERYMKDELIGPKELVAFLRAEQGEEVTEERALELIRDISHDDETLDELEFELFLVSHWNEAYDPARRERHHDMSKPLSHYYVDSSHNTYLTGDQLKSDSSIEMYIRAFRMGCRCVELDIWDGDRNEPVVYHGYTLTSKIPFRDIIHVIKSHGFVSTPYPIILSFENHCSKKTQERMAEILTETLGDMLQAPPRNLNGVLPSPEDLKNKVLIKGKMTSSSITEDMEEIEEDGLVDEAAATLSGVASAAAATQPAPTSGRFGRKKKAPVKKEKIAEALSKLTYLRAVHFDGFEETKEWEANHMSSFSEPKTWKILGKGEGGFESFREYTEKNMARIYPKGTRFDSSNYDPILPWIAGCQIVALNYQTDSVPMWINYARFSENGHAGYNLRPETTHAHAGTIRPASSKVSSVSIRMFGARMLPSGGRDILDPFVVISLFDGHEGELEEEGDRIRVRTPTIPNNGFNPDWDFQSALQVRDSANSFIVFQVIDEDFGKNTKVGHACIPVECLRPGFRVIHLYDSNFKKIAKGMANLFVHISLK